MREQTCQADGDVDQGVEASTYVARANAVAVAVHVRAHHERTFGGGEQHCDIGGTCGRLCTGKCETTREVACRADGPAAFDACTELRNRGGGKYRDETRCKYNLDEGIAVRRSGARGPRAARRAPATRHVCY